MYAYTGKDISDCSNTNSPLIEQQHLSPLIPPKQYSPPSAYTFEKETPIASHNTNNSTLFNEEFKQLVEQKMKNIKEKRSKSTQLQSKLRVYKSESISNNREINYAFESSAANFNKGKDFIIEQYEKTVDEMKQTILKEKKEKEMIEETMNKSNIAMAALIQRNKNKQK